MPEQEKLQIVVCMGSSCFSRGNGRLLKALQNYVRDMGAEHRVAITGSLCENSCTAGPNVTINGRRHSITTPEDCLRLVSKHLAAPDELQSADLQAEDFS